METPSPSPSPPSEEKPYDPKVELADFGDYDELALDQYRALSFYFAQRRNGATRAQAATLTCELFGHDAPRGLCRRCGLGVDLSKDDSAKRRLADRDAFLASRH